MYDYIPRALAKLLTWLKNFITYLNQNEVISRLSLDRTRVDKLKSEIDAYAELCTLADAANAGSVDRLKRREKAEKLTKSVRNFVNTFLRYNEAMTDDDRKQLGLTVPSGKRSSGIDPDEYPEIEANTNVLRRIVCRFLNREHRAAKPRHVHGIELRFGFIPEGEEPSLAHLVNSLFSTRTSMTIDFADGERGKLIGLCARYENNTGGKGPFGPIITVYIP
ncbi:MAG: hypothetical protein LBK96_06040 [Prevotellaceae bacterium]|jgi:hypothetical protein|nr:hypothetical protein [Prevotellaceae bacterium]